MDRKSFIVLAGAALLLVALSPIVDHFFPPKPLLPLLPGQTNVPKRNRGPAQAPDRNTAGTTPATSYAPRHCPAAPIVPEQTLTVTNEDLVFQFTSEGGGLKKVSLEHYPAVISRTGGETPSNPIRAALLTPRPRSRSWPWRVRALQGDNYFTLTQNGPVVRAEKTLTNGLRLIKEFTISTNYLFTARVILTNTSAQALIIPQPRVSWWERPRPSAPSTIRTRWRFLRRWTLRAKRDPGLVRQPHPRLYSGNAAHNLSGGRKQRGLDGGA